MSLKILHFCTRATLLGQHDVQHVVNCAGTLSPTKVASGQRERLFFHLPGSRSDKEEMETHVTLPGASG